MTQQSLLGPDAIEVGDYTERIANLLNEQPLTIVAGTLASWRRSRTWATAELVQYKPGTTVVTARVLIGIPGKPAAAIERHNIENNTPLTPGTDVIATGRPELHPVYGFRFLTKQLISLDTSSRERAREQLERLADHNK